MNRRSTGNRTLRPITMLAVCLLALLQPNATAAQPDIQPASGLRVFEQVDKWVRDWDLPPAGTPEANSQPVCAATITLRIGGRVIGRGTAASPDPDPTLVWRAASRAMNAANSRLTDDQDAGWEAVLREMSSRIMITLELADELIPISPNELGLPGFGYSPGSVGFAVRLGDQADAVGPGSIILKTTDPARTTCALALTLSDDPNLVLQSPVELNDQGFRFYRWVPLSIAQPTPELGGVFLDRGGRAVELSEISVRSIRDYSDRIAQHLLDRQWDGVENYGFAGTLDPVTGKVGSPFAGNFEQALGAYALLRFGNDAITPLQRECVVGARQILRELSRVEGEEVAPWDDPLGACMAIIALSEVPLELILGDPGLSELRTKSAEAIAGAYTAQGGFSSDIPRAARGLVAHALVASAKLDPKDRSTDAASAISSIYLDTPPEMLVAQMPFLAWAQIGQAGSGEVTGASQLRAMRELVWEHQLRRADLDWIDRDLAGGVVFTRSSAPLPSWSVMRPLTAIAAMLRDQRLTPGSIASGEVPAEISRLIDSVRFVRQLAAEGETLHMYSDAQDAQWGVRMALWDQRQPIETSAMALLVMLETSASLKAIGER